jgi:hypothetical protein
MTNTAEAKKKNAKKLLVAASALLLVGAGCDSQVSSNTNASAGTGPADDGNSMVNDPGTPGASTYKDGTYTVIGKYTSPAGPETIGVTVTLASDVIVDASVEKHATHDISVKMQDQFIAGFKEQVVSKDIDEVNVGKVAGSSLTPKGFNDALAQIKVQAAAN